jgi:hypothetical protein
VLVYLRLHYSDWALRVSPPAVNEKNVGRFNHKSLCTAI